MPSSSHPFYLYDHPNFLNLMTVCVESINHSSSFSLCSFISSVVSKLPPQLLTRKHLSQISLLHVRHEVPQTYRTTGTQSLLKILNWWVGNYAIVNVLMTLLVFCSHHSQLANGFNHCIICLVPLGCRNVANVKRAN
jgi:hypothetical protein